MRWRYLIAIWTLAAVGCRGDEAWETKDIAGVLPALAFELTAEDHRTLTEHAFRGDVTAVFFGYTNCPDVCPVTMARLHNAIRALPPAARDRLKVLFVSVDPQRDTPEALATYTDAFGPEFVGLTASEATLRDLTKHYRATFSYGEPGEHGYAVSHPSAVYVFDGQGRARLLIRDGDSVEAISHDLRRLVELEGSTAAG